MSWLIAIAASVGDPAEGPEIGHAHGKRFSCARHDRGEVGGGFDGAAQVGDQRFLAWAIE
jgi:hypothetical protein